MPLKSRCSRKWLTPGVRVVLVPRAGADPEADRDRAHRGQRLGDDPRPAVERRQQVVLHARIVQRWPRPAGRRRPGRRRHGEGGEGLERRTGEARAPLTSSISPRTSFSTVRQTMRVRAIGKVVRGKRSSAAFTPQEAQRWVPSCSVSRSP